MGYHMAGFEVTGVDNELQPHYPFDFYQFDLTKITDRQIANIGRNFDAIAGSPPCKGFSVATPAKYRGNHPNLIPQFREIAQATGLPYIIENVPNAPLIDPIQLCGSAFGLRVRRHRLFESNMELTRIRCNHGWQDRHKPYIQIEHGPGSERMSGVIYVYGRGDGTHLNGLSQVEIWRVAMGIDWMDTDEIAQAIPPAYTFYLGRQLMEMI